MTDGFYESFEIETRKGKKIDVIDSGKEFFSGKGIDIVEYRIASPTITKELSSGTRRFLDHSCDCCGSDLTKVESGGTNLKIKPKRHMIWIDKSDNMYKTCYKKKGCLDVANDKTRRYRDVLLSEKKMTLKSFWAGTYVKEIDRDYFLADALYNKRYECLESTFENYIIPFVRKWSKTPIDKTNVMVFMDHFEILKNHTDYYHSSLTKSLFIDKIIVLIGAINER